MIVGAFASGAWGEPRFTRDIDVALAYSADETDRLLTAFSAADYGAAEGGREAPPVSRRQQRFTLEHRVTGIRIDIIAADGNPQSTDRMRRRRRVELTPSLSVWVAAPDDLIIHKMGSYNESGIETPLRDITGIMKVSGEEVDRAYVERWAKELGLMEIWQAIVRRLNKRTEAGGNDKLETRNPKSETNPESKFQNPK